MYRTRSIWLLALMIMSLSGVNAAKPLEEDKQLSNEEYIKKFAYIFLLIDKYYVKEPNKQKMLEAALNGMASSLDPHSSYLNKEEYEDLDEHIKGEFGGIGIEVIYDNNAIKVISPLDDLPAFKAGMQPGDLIVAVDDNSVADLGFIKSVKLMRGKAGTKVHLTVLREGLSKALELDLVREIVKTRSVKYNIDDNIAYIRIASFNETTKDELGGAITSLIKDNHKPVKGMILDLRNNPGGLLSQALAVSNFFIDEGIIVSTHGRMKEDVTIQLANSNGLKAPKVPLVVLINSGSASASEIVAGALQDHNRAIILGTKSFGKGTVQDVKKFFDGALKLTIDEYKTPIGRSIQNLVINTEI